MIAAVILLGFAVLYLAVLCPWHKPSRRIVPGQYAHRGLHDAKSAENSMEAFEKAVKYGYGIELDVRLSLDGEVVVFHDDTLLRACGKPERVDTHSLAELKDMTIFKTACHIPEFSKVLEMVNGRVPLIVEIKTGGKRKELCEKTAKILENYSGAYCVESFDPRIVLWFKKNAPDILRGQLSKNFLREKEPGMPLPLAVLLTGMLINFLTRPDFVAYQLSDKRDIPFALCRFLFREPAAAWTVRSLKEEKQTKKFFDAIIFENFRP